MKRILSILLTLIITLSIFIMPIKSYGATNIKFLCLIAAPEGIEALTKAHPDVQIYCANVDEGLNENCYIVPGLGDAGDRIFGTK